MWAPQWTSLCRHAGEPACLSRPFALPPRASARDAAAASRADMSAPAPTCAPPLIPPFRFAAVEHGVLRGAHPTLKNYRFLRRLRLRTVVSLNAEPAPAEDLAGFCAAEGVDLVVRRAVKYDDGDVLSMAAPLVAEVLAVLLDPARHPVFLHCRDGGHNTGLVIMCLRRLQHWTNEAIHGEHRRYTKGGEIHYQEQQFVEAFSGPVNIPYLMPAWLWGGVRISAHPSVKIHYAPLPSPPSPVQPQLLPSSAPPGTRPPRLPPSAWPSAASSPSSDAPYRTPRHSLRMHGSTRPPSPTTSVASAPGVRRPDSVESVGIANLFVGDGSGNGAGGSGGSLGVGVGGNGGASSATSGRYQLPPSAAGLAGAGASLTAEWELGRGGVGSVEVEAADAVSRGGGGSPAESLDGADDYQSWPGVTVTTPYSLQLAGLALAGLELAPQPSSAKAAASARAAAAASSKAAAVVAAANGTRLPDR